MSRSPADTAIATPMTRTPSARRRAVGGWALIAVVLLGVAVLGMALSGIGQWTDRDALDPESAAPQGTRAIVQVLRDQGVDVIVARDRASAATALSEHSATLVLPAAPALSDAAVGALIADATDVVLIDPRARELRLALPGSAATGFGQDAATAPACEIPDANRAGEVTAGTLFSRGTGAVGCYPVDDAFALIVGDRAAALDGRSILANDRLAVAGNAALAVNLLAVHGRVVWYVPSLADTDLADSAPSLGELTPAWVTPAIVVLLAAALAAALWRGRRFGPLVAERLPVTVRASETTAGRARLYERARDPLHAADQLRAGAIERLSRMLSLGAAATAAEIADAAAERLGADRAVVRGILLDDVPATDTELVALSDRLRDLENAVRAAVRPERNRP